MLDGKDRTAVFNAEYRLLDMIYVGLRLWSLTKKLGNECRNRSHVICGRVLLALAHVLDSSHLTFEIILPERVVGRTVATDVVIDNELAHYACVALRQFRSIRRSTSAFQYVQQFPARASAGVGVQCRLNSWV